MLFPSIHPTPHSEAVHDYSESSSQALDTSKRDRQVKRVLLHGLGSLGQTTIRIGPKADQEDPMLDEHREEFGIHLTQDAPGFGAARLVHAALALPQLEEQLNLPPHASKHQGLPQCQALGRHLGYEESPRRQPQPGGTDLAPFVPGGLPQAPAAGIGNVLGHAHGQQTRGETRALTSGDGQLDGVRGLDLQEFQELPAGPGGVVDGGLHLEPGEPEHLVLRKCCKGSQTPVA